MVTQVTRAPRCARLLPLLGLRGHAKHRPGKDFLQENPKLLLRSMFSVVDS
jgi:hypothetical protein